MSNMCSIQWKAYFVDDASTTAFLEEFQKEIAAADSKGVGVALSDKEWLHDAVATLPEARVVDIQGWVKCHLISDDFMVFAGRLEEMGVLHSTCDFEETGGNHWGTYSYYHVKSAYKMEIPVDDDCWNAFHDDELSADDLEYRLASMEPIIIGSESNDSCKILTARELVDIVKRAEDEINCSDNYDLFMEELGNLIADHFGSVPGTSGFHDDDPGWSMAFIHNDSVPPKGGVFAKYDTDVVWPPKEA